MSEDKLDRLMDEIIGIKAAIKELVREIRGNGGRGIISRLLLLESTQRAQARLGWICTAAVVTVVVVAVVNMLFR